ncbi:competence protein ComGC [Halobacillus karajensis]|uniref:ComG operon protein 3 n=1 Tax=Halobacillus karajensis TaxID=195088 RepID=A0A024P6C9_9BACI|nr:competence type IV pilus major pilin ComGC [Halobacillus karajensis]CDQ17984.1 ComG operon protein 3 precursor [Halobacillus karajensis]CDQ24333.1 ComG operon protein 3 precursor [Halobacillus karajensis]CDQ29418.1 ComG operon protein 3 precursor [Halobacillus karajensis]SEH61518.1 competence protein ComGC [Halobacillus karajensis]
MFKNEKGFTLIEMLIVLLVISILLIITIPNMSKNSTSVRAKGCEALIKTTEAQVEAYFIDHKVYPDDLSILVEEDYISQEKCPNGKSLVLVDGVVKTIE